MGVSHWRKRQHHTDTIFILFQRLWCQAFFQTLIFIRILCKTALVTLLVIVFLWTTWKRALHSFFFSAKKRRNGNNQQEQASACSCWWKGEQNLTNAVTRGLVGTIPKKKNLIIIITATDFPAIWPLKKEHKNSILITRPSPDLGCIASSLWNFCVCLVPQRFDFAGKPMMVLRNFGCSLRLAYFEEKAKAYVILSCAFSSLLSSEYLHHFLATIWQLIITIYTAQKQ